MTPIPRAPAGLEARGRKMWRSIHEQHPTISDPEREVALEACRVADRLERLDAICRSSEPVIETDKGGLITHPAFAEARQQQNLLKQMIAALRLPEASGKRPQTRPARGTQAPKGAGGNVTAMEKFRTAAGG